MAAAALLPCLLTNPLTGLTHCHLIHQNLVFTIIFHGSGAVHQITFRRCGGPISYLPVFIPFLSQGELVSSL